MAQDVSDRTTETEPTEQPQTETGWSIDKVSIKDPPTEFGAVPLPDEETRYPQMGMADDVATLYGNWKCPYTREFVVDQLPSFIEEYVRPGELSIQFRSVSYRDDEPFLGRDAPTASHAGIAVWETDPDAFWNYFRYVFANQPQERYEWAKPPLLERFAERAGVDDPEHIAQSAADHVFTPRVQASADNADRYDIWSVPRIRYDGTVTAPTVNPERTRAQLD